MKASLFWRGTLVVLLLSSCSSSDSWAVSYLDGKGRSSSKLVYAARDIVNGVDLEFLRVGEELHTYLQVHSQMIPAFNGNAKEALVTFNINGTTHSGVAYRHEGGQRILLPEPLQNLLIEALKENKSVKIELQGYQATIEPGEFHKRLGDLNSNPIRNPFNIPLNL